MCVCLPSIGFTFTHLKSSSSPRSISRPSPDSKHPARGWINVWLWETCRWQMFAFIMHDFHVGVNFSEPAKSRKWFCTLCLFNEIVTLMEVRLNKMETTVSICHFYNVSPIPPSLASSSVFMDQCKWHQLEANGKRPGILLIPCKCGWEHSQSCGTSL